MALGDAKPFPKTAQLARKERRYRRKVAGAKRWAMIADSKQGPCRCCGKPPTNQLHHLVARAHGGSDTEANIAALCQDCHARVELRYPDVCRRLVESLSDAEYAYVVEVGGEAYFERRYGLRYERAT